MEELIMTRHPQVGKQGTRILKAKYDVIRAAILETLRSTGEMTFRELVDAVEAKLAGRFDGSIPWYVTTVKLDLEARGEIERLPKSRPQHLRLVVN